MSAVTGLAGGVLMAFSVSALPHPWTIGYVSEAGAPGARWAWAYRTGVALLAITLLLLGLALRSEPLRSEQLRSEQLRSVALDSAERVCLLLGGALAAVSSRVSCTAGCPLPPYEHTTAQDLVHAGASTSAIGLTTLAMLIMASTRPGRDRRIARIGFAICAPLLAALAIALITIGRGTATAILERVALVGVLGWVEVCAVRRAL